MTPPFLALAVDADRDEPPRRLALVRDDDVPFAIVRVGVAAGTAMVRAGLRAFLERDEDVTVAGEAATAGEALALALRMGRGVMVLDVGLAGLNCVATIQRIRAHGGIAVLVLCDSGADERVDAALRAGAQGIVLRDAGPADIVRAVRLLGRSTGAASDRFTRTATSEFARYHTHCRPTVVEIGHGSAHANRGPAADDPGDRSDARFTPGRCA
jgi:DNA-binding NarL/FixJ family response regulator